MKWVGKAIFALLVLMAALIVADGGVMSFLSDNEATDGNAIKAYSPSVWTQTTEDDFTSNTTSSYIDTSSESGDVRISASPVALGAAASFAILAGTGITVTGGGLSTVTGDVGTYPTTAETGFESLTLIGTDHKGDAVTQAAKVDLATAYGDAAGRTPVTTIGTELGGTVVTPGIYVSEDGTFEISGVLELGAGGDSNAVFIFKMAATLNAEVGSQVNLVGGAKAANVFWVVGSSATVGSGADFSGIILAYLSITLNSDATLEGRALAMNGAVTIAANTITVPFTSGWLNSSVFDTGVPDAKFDSMFWDGVLPSGTNMVLFFRASNIAPVDGTSGLTGAWIDLGDAFYASLAGITGRYVQWRVVMDTTDLSLSPVLSEVRIYYRGF
ncbi:MAG: ice-binding family protein [Methanomassiliicoccales archaeon]|jgi:hypothetical protein